MRRSLVSKSVGDSMTEFFQLILRTDVAWEYEEVIVR